jgi:hypothetical protein
MNADSDPAPHQSDANLRPLVCRPSKFILSLHCELPGHHFEPLKLPNFDFNTDPDPDPQLWYGNAEVLNALPAVI